MEQTLFEFTLITPQGDKASGSPQIVYLLAWSDDCDMAGTSEPMLQYIEESCHKKWKIKQVSAAFMLGVRRTLVEQDDGVWVLTLTQEEYIDGLVEAYKDQIVLAGFGKANPDSPVPKGEWLSLADEISDAEAEEVSKLGYKAVCGSLIWVSRFAHKEISEGISVACRVMSRPSRKAWKHCMQMCAWLRDNKRRGMRFRSDYAEHGLVASCDASNKPDKHDSRCQRSDVVQWMGGTIGMGSCKLSHTGYGSPANEYMAIRAAASRVRKFRNMFIELGRHEVIAKPTQVYVDNNVAIHWVKTGKITEGNQYLDLAYHQPREWEKDGSVQIRAIHTEDNVSDLGSKPCGPTEMKRFLRVLCGYEKWEIKNDRPTITFT